MPISEDRKRERRARRGAPARGASRLRAALAVLLAAGAGADERADLEPTLEAFMAGMAGTSGVVAQFRETKELGLLSVPLEARGTLYFVPPDRLARLTTEPARSRLVIDGDRFAYRDAAGGEAADLASNPLAREFVKSFIVLFNGDLEALRERYEPTFRVSDGASERRWSLSLRPRRRPLSDVVESVTLEGRGRLLERIELRERDGDRTVTTFERIELDRRFGDAELERIFALPGEDAAAP